jgi:folate-binding protein YgfZ
MQLLEHTAAEAAGLPISVRRWERRPGGFHLACNLADASRIAEGLTDAGAQPCSPAAAEMLRVELGWPWFGRDIHSDNLPQEVGRNERAISFTKGCYLGQETVARIDALGHVNWRLTGLRFAPDDRWDAASELQVDGKTVARLTSRSYSPQLGAVLAMAYVRRGWEKPGTRLPGPVAEAEVVALPVW